MRPTEEELQECYKLVRDVTGKINDEKIRKLKLKDILKK